jgi:hypothetical protein
MLGSPRRVGAITAEQAARVGLVAAFATLEDVVAWRAGVLVDVIVQDEYTHDVVVRVGQTDVYACFDTT